MTITYPGVSVGWTWDGSHWLRRQGGTPHVSDGSQIAAANVVVVVVPEIRTGMVDSAGFNVPEYVFAGSGVATVFTNGQRIDGTWTRPCADPGPGDRSRSTPRILSWGLLGPGPKSMHTHPCM